MSRLPLLLTLLAIFGVASVSTGTQAAKPEGANNLATATFAGGCFWCVEKDFDHVPGVVETISGYTGGSLKDPTYHKVTAGGTGHREAVRIMYDPNKVSYATLLDVFWHSVDPTDGGGQFCDRGHSYETAVFFHTDEQRRLAEHSKRELTVAKVLPDPVVTPIEAASELYPAEDYHQDYYKKNPTRYALYRFSCGRDRRISTVWGDSAHRGIKK